MSVSQAQARAVSSRGKPDLMRFVKSCELNFATRLPLAPPSHPKRSEPANANQPSSQRYPQLQQRSLLAHAARKFGLDLINSLREDGWDGGGDGREQTHPKQATTPLHTAQQLSWAAARVVVPPLRRSVAAGWFGIEAWTWRS